MRRQWFRLLTGLGAVLALANVAMSAELELYHSDFHARLGMKIYAVVGEAAGGAQLKATLTGPVGAKVILEKKDKLAKEEPITLILRDLPKGKYTLKVELLDASGKTVKEAYREWEKPYDGIPRVGIDENNAICVAGKPFFPITTWGVGEKEQDFDEWGACVNTMNGYTFSKDSATLDGWRKFLDAAQKHDKKVMGPDYGNYWPNGDCRRFYTQDGNKLKDRESKLGVMEEYVKGTKDHPALLMWAWLDEPELDTARDCVPPAEVRKWTEMCHRSDPQHPVFLNTGGGGFARPVDNWLHKHLMHYTYLHNDIPGPRHLLADVISQDIYPRFGEDLAKVKAQQQATTRAGRPVPELPTIENLCLAMDRMREYNRNLAPFWANVKTAGAQERTGGLPPPRPEHIRVCCWASVIHGAKGLSWFHYFGPTPEENKAEMKRFLDQTSRLATVIGGADYAGPLTSKTTGRVDWMAKEAQGAVYVIAANIKEIADKATFTLDFATRKIEVFDESRELKANGQGFSDDFGPLAVHIYKLTK